MKSPNYDPPLQEWDDDMLDRTLKDAASKIGPAITYYQRLANRVALDVQEEISRRAALRR